MTSQSPAKAKRPRQGRSRARAPEDQKRVVDNIVEAARELFSEKGYEAVNMRAVAARAGYTAGAIYSYFKTKRQLLLTIWAEDTWGSYHAAKAATAGRSKPTSKMRRVFQAYAHYWCDRPAQFRNLFGTRDHRDSTEDDYFHQSEVIEALFGLFENVVADALEEVGAKLNPQTEYQAMFNYIQGILDMRLLMGPKHPWPPAKKLVDMAVDGAIARWRESSSAS